jgi:DNA-binding GntR family transcriptional regulator
VLRAVAAGDVAAARAAMRIHLGNSHDRFAAAWIDATPPRKAA